MWWNFLLATWVATAVFASAQESEPEVRCRLLSYAFFPVEKNCSKFVFCRDGQADEFSCRDDEIWSQETGACILGDSKTCTAWSPEMACGGNNTTLVLPHPRNCSQFVQCSEEGSSLEDCAEGSIFQKDRCVVGSWEECESYEFMCEEVENARLVHPDRCDAFINCGTENVTLEVCPEGEIFSIEVRQCVLGNLTTCEPLPVSEICENRDNQTLAHPYRCQSFVQCSETKDPSVLECPRGMIWSTTSEKCELGSTETCTLLDQVCMNVTVGNMLAHPDGCDLYIRCLEEEIPQLEFCAPGRIWRQDMMTCVPGNQIYCEPTPIYRICHNLPFGIIFPHPESCSILVQCNIGGTIEIPCPPHHILQPITLNCVVGNQKDCTSYDKLCNGKPNGVLALPNVCEAFIFCRNESAEIQECPPGDIFNATLGRCTPGIIETCEFFECTEQSSVSRHPNYCNLFTRCMDGQISTQFCPLEHIFHENMRRCTPGNVTACEYDDLENMCQGRFNNAVYPYPTVDEQCTDYVLCIDNQARKQTCPAGMVLRPEHLDCVPGAKETCEAFDMVCSAIEQSVIVHPSSCDMKIICNNGVFTVEVCPSGQIVDPDNLGCVLGSCQQVNECIGKPDGVYEYSDCSRYVVCNNQEMTVSDCPEREIFLANKGICFPGLNTDCEPFPVETMCEGRESLSVYPDLDNCSQFITCSNNQPSRGSCERGNIYSASNSRCLAGAVCEVIEGCENAADSTIRSHPEGCDLFVECQDHLPYAMECPPEHIMISESSGVCIPGYLDTCTSICYGQPEGMLLPNSESCTDYYECIDHETINQRTCPPETIFNQPEGRCVPGDVKTCLPENRCRGKPDGRYEYDPPDCSRFMICQEETMTVENCPDQEIFLANLGICFPGTAQGCATLPLQTMCQDRAAGSIYPDLDDCSYSITCMNNQATRTQCPRGNIYRPDHRKCLAGTVDCEHHDLCLTQEDGTVLLYPGDDCGLLIRCESHLSKAEECPTGEIITSETDGRCVPGDIGTCTPTAWAHRFLVQTNNTGRINQ